MVLKGKFRVSDTWQGAAKSGKAMRASATLNDTEDGGQLRVNFPDGEIPIQFGIDVIVEDLHVKPNNTNYGLMLNFQGFSKPIKP